MHEKMLEECVRSFTEQNKANARIEAKLNKHSEILARIEANGMSHYIELTGNMKNQVSRSNRQDIRSDVQDQRILKLDDRLWKLMLLMGGSGVVGGAVSAAIMRIG